MRKVVIFFFAAIFSAFSQKVSSHEYAASAYGCLKADIIFLLDWSGSVSHDEVNINEALKYFCRMV